MAMNVRKAFLHNSEDHHLYPRRKAQIFSYVQSDLDVASLLEPFDIPTQSGSQPHLIEQRRVKQIGSRTQLLRYGPNELRILIELSRQFWIPGFLAQVRQIHDQHRQ